jgi:hypothetical protein
LQNKQVVKELDQQIMFATEKGCLGQNLQRMFGIEFVKKCVVDQPFLLPIFLPKATLKF